MSKISEQKNKYKILVSILYVIGYFFSSAILNSIFAVFISDTIYFLFSYLLLGFILFIIFRKKIVSDLDNFKGKDFVLGLKWWLIGFVLMMIINYIIVFLTGDIAANEEGNRTLLSNTFLASFLTMGIIAPFNEEIIFRLNIRNAFFNTKYYIITSALLFGYIHVMGASLIYIIPYAILGAAFAIMHHKTNNIWTSVTLHMIHNIVAIIFIILGGTL